VNLDADHLEDAVRREAAVKLGPVAYQGSQPWPLPAGLMLGFRAQALPDAVFAGHDELAGARWFTRCRAAPRVRRRAPQQAGVDRELPDHELAARS